MALGTAHGGSVESSSSVVDLGAPILPQLAALGDDYRAWAYRPVRIEGSVRIFEQGWLEALSRTPWWLVPLVWIPVSSALLVVAFEVSSGSSASVIGYFMAGVLSWQLLEYVLHRFVFHYAPRSAFGRRLHFLGHGIHHVVPSDRLRLVFPPVPAMLIALAIFLTLRLVLPLGAALAVTAGIVAGYLAYDLIHYYTHHGRPRSRVGRWLQRYHMTHHFKHPDRQFGVTQPLFDLVFGTYRA